MCQSLQSLKILMHLYQKRKIRHNWEYVIKGQFFLLKIFWTIFEHIYYYFMRGLKQLQL
jgi:hypothetical protein